MKTQTIVYYHLNSDKIAYKKVINDDGSWIEETYDEKGNPLTLKDSDGFWTESTYNDNGNRLTFKDSKGSWIECTYNDKGRLLNEKYSNGYWTERTYNENGNLLTYKESTGFMDERTYDNEGNRLTYRNSNGHFEIKGERVTKEEFESFEASMNTSDNQSNNPLLIKIAELEKQLHELKEQVENQ